MKAAGAPYRGDRYLVAQVAVARGLITELGAAGAIAIAYFLAARLGLALISASSDLAVFWPALGVAAGILIVLGRRGLPAGVIGMVVGTVGADLMSNRSLLICLVNGSWNAGEAVLATWLLERCFGRPFTFVDPRRLVGFLAATSFATAAASTITGAATIFMPRPLRHIWTPGARGSRGASSDLSWSRPSWLG